MQLTVSGSWGCLMGEIGRLENMSGHRVEDFAKVGEALRAVGLLTMVSGAHEAWYLENGGSPAIERQPDGTRVVLRDATEFIKTNLGNLPALGLQDIVQPDGTLHLDTAGEHRYRPIGDLDWGFTAYERIRAEM